MTTTLVIERHERASLRSRAVAAGVRGVLRPRMARAGRTGFGPADLERAASIDRFAGRFRPPKGIRYDPVELDGFGAEWVHGPRVTDDRGGKVLLYFHGGGWVSCGLNTHRRMIAWMSTTSRIPALSVDYRMIPQVKFDEEVDDCLTAYKWLLDRGHRPDQIVVAGDSAGGYLTFATLLKARDEGLPMPAGLVALSPMLDMDLASKRAHANATADPSGSMKLVEQLVEMILGGLDPADPKVSPIRADLTGLPPALITAGSTEVLYCDAEEMAHRLAEAGVPCTLQIWDRQLHVFQMFGPLLPESRTALRDIGRFVRARLSP
jgi:acetyl esterase/lipase